MLEEVTKFLVIPINIVGKVLKSQSVYAKTQYAGRSHFKVNDIVLDAGKSAAAATHTPQGVSFS